VCEYNTIRMGISQPLMKLFCSIVKPSPFTPLMTLKIMSAAQKHLPPGVLNVVVGDNALGPMLTEHPDINHVGLLLHTYDQTLIYSPLRSPLLVLLPLVEWLQRAVRPL
jgi:hypothetical protein